MPSPPDRVDAHLPLKPEIFQILLALSERDSLHGYGILKSVEHNTDGRMQLAPSLLYRRIRRLLEESIVAETEAPEGNDDERRRYYRLTDLGNRVLAAEASRLVELVDHEHVRQLARQSQQR